MSCILITGAHGYLGDLLVRHYLERSDWQVVALSSQANDKWTETKRVTWIRADIVTDELRQLPALITHVVHTAAVTRFDVPRDIAEAVNVEGSRKVWEAAARLPRLQMAVHVSSLYATGLLDGRIDEALVEQPAFANWYEWSKWQSEVELVKNFADLPVAVVRLGTLIADDDSGRVVQYNAVHMALKLWFYGLLSVIPGDADANLHLLTGEFAAERIAGLLDSAQAGVYNAAPAGPPMHLGDWVTLCADEFARNHDYQRRGVLTPLLADEQTFADLHAGFRNTGSTVITSALDVLSPFSPQLYLRKVASTERLSASLGAEFPLDTRSVVQNMCNWIMDTRWGKR